MKKQAKSHFPSCLIKTGHLPAQSRTDDIQKKDIWQNFRKQDHEKYKYDRKEICRGLRVMGNNTISYYCQDFRPWWPVKILSLNTCNTEWFLKMKSGSLRQGFSLKFRENEKRTPSLGDYINDHII